MPEGPSDKKAEAEKHKVSLWEALRDVLIVAMNRGQLLGITLAIGFFIILFRLPAEELSEFVRTLLRGFADLSYVGYAIAVAAIVGWRAHVQRLIRKHELEEKRMAEQRNILQERGLGTLLESSNDEEEVK